MRRGERFDLIGGASSGSICGAITAAGLAEEGPEMWRSLASTPIVSTRYLSREKSLFGMSSIVRDALERYLPPGSLGRDKTELLVTTTRARAYAERAIAAKVGRAPIAAADEARVVHSSRDRADMHEVIVASCTIPIIYASLPRIDGEAHLDGGAVDNTLIGTLIERGADELTIVTPFANGHVAQTLFTEGPLSVPPHVRVRLIHPRHPLRQKRFDFAPEPMEEALAMPHVERIIEPWRSASGAIACDSA